MNAKMGIWAFVVGLVLAAIVAIWKANAPPAWALFVIAVLGVLVGLLNVTDKETQAFLIATVAFMLSFSSLATITEKVALGWAAIGTFFNLMGVFIAPAAAVVAVKALFNLAKD
ncbi:MAG: hypothetical protein V1735_06805 [Nanoarchaeota archaeon]